ncbi:MAG: trimethylamine methyltransferase family protein [Phycisphaerae bacterium]
MRIRTHAVECMEESEIKAIVEYAIRILDEVGMKIESTKMCEHLAATGARWDGEFRVHFPRKLIEEHLTKERRPKDRPPQPAWRSSGGISGYPIRYFDPHQEKVVMHTARTVADLTRVADFVPNIDGIGSVGVPSDIPPLLQPFWMRLLTWRYAGQTLSNSYVLWDPRLCPYILEFVQAVAEMEPQQGGMERWLRANNYMISPLHYARAEAEEFVWFWSRGWRCTFGNLLSIGAAAPVTLAGAIGMGLAESMAISFIMNAFYGDKGLYLHTGMAPLDMRTGYMPYGRPEQMLTSIAAAQICDYLGTDDAYHVHGGTAAKMVDVECGLNKGFAAAMQLATFGDVSWNYGIHSTDEVTDPRLVIIENEFVEMIKRVQRGFEVSPATLPIDVVKEVGPGGSFLDHPHTMEHFRDELWMPELFNGVYYEGWLASGGQSILEKARIKVLDILDSYHPRGIKQETEDRLLSLIDKYARELGIGEYKRPTNLPA